MNYDNRAVVGHWYRHPDGGQVFQVVSIDEDGGAVEVQYFDGTVDELRLAEWHVFDIEHCAEPQDWTGPFDGIVRDDLGATETDMSPADWHEPYQGDYVEEPEDTEVAEADAFAGTQAGWDEEIDAPELTAPVELLFAATVASPRRNRRAAARTGRG